jgi:hypothetical protein
MKEFPMILLATAFNACDFFFILDFKKEIYFLLLLNQAIESTK